MTALAGIPIAVLIEMAIDGYKLTEKILAAIQAHPHSDPVAVEELSKRLEADRELVASVEIRIP